MRDKQVDPAHRQPVGVPFDVPARKLPRVVVLVAGAKALVGVAAAVHQPGGVGAALGHRGVDARQAVLFGGEPAQHQILPRHGKVFFYFYIIALVGVPHQADAVRLAPAGECAVVDLALALQKQLVIQPCIVVFPAVKQGGEVGGVAARTAENLGKAVRPREHTADIAPQNTRLIGKKADDRGSEILFQFPIVGFVGQFNKAADGRRVQNISSFGGVFLAVILAPVQPAHRAAAFAHDQRAVFRLRQQLVPRQNGLGQRDALAGKLRVILYDQPARRAGGVHPFIVQNDFHIQRGGGFDSRADMGKVAFTQIGDVGAKPHARVQYHAVNAVGGKVRQLAAQLLSGQLAVQKPKRDGGKFSGRVLQLGKKLHYAASCASARAQMSAHAWDL